MDRTVINQAGVEPFDQESDYSCRIGFNTARIDKLQEENRILRVVVIELRDKITNLNAQTDTLLAVLNLVSGVLSNVNSRLGNIDGKLSQQNPCREHMYCPE